MNTEPPATFEAFLAMRVDCMGVGTFLASLFSRRARVHFYADVAAEYIGMYSFRKQQNVFCKYTCRTFQELKRIVPTTDITCLSFADLVNSHMDTPVQLDPGLLDMLRKEI